MEGSGKGGIFAVDFRGNPPAQLGGAMVKAADRKLVAMFKKYTNKMNKELRSGYKAATAAPRGAAWHKGQKIETVKGVTLNVEEIFTKEGACALYQCASENNDYCGFFTSMELKKMAGVELAPRNGVAGATRVRPVKKEDIPTLYKNYIDKFDALVNKINALQSKYNLGQKVIIAASKNYFETIQLQRIVAAEVARKESKAEKEKEAATENFAAAVGIDYNDLTPEIIECIKAQIAAKKAAKK